MVERRKLCICSGESGMALVAPYFLESKIVGTGLEMLDYRVEYENHRKFGGKAGPSPVRLFVTHQLAKTTLPQADGYKCAF